MTIEDGNQELVNELYIKLSASMSNERLSTYLRATGQNKEKALNLYIWNARISAEFYLPLQAVEVGLRNRVIPAITSVYGEDWWEEDSDFRKNCEGEAIRAIKRAIKRIKNENKAVNHGQVVSVLTFGFWVNVLDSYYNIELWSRELRNCFPDLPQGKTRTHLHTSAANTAQFRNRVFHHEPIHALDLGLKYSQIMELLSWISPATKDWVKPHCKIPTLLREKPRS